MKFLKAVRLDDSDDRVLSGQGGAARDGEWLVSGGYAVCDLAKGHAQPNCRCDRTFVALGSRRRCTLAEVAEIDEAAFGRLQEVLAHFFLNELGAPSLEAARAAAADECEYTAGLSADFPEDVWITVQREPTAEGVGERYSVFKRLMIGSHKV
ncbi:MAG: hypothetical protein FJY54_06905 [Betaproteobacteria bacterium]|nr:hypothetical protein [Betaproteobacteria bacterium]